MSKEQEMDKDLDARLIQYTELFDQLTDETVEEFRKFASPIVRYRDPLTDAKGIDAGVAYLHKICADLDGLQIETKGYARNGRLAFTYWQMTFRIKRNPKKLWQLDGVSKIVFDDAGKIEDQIDYWDSSPLLEGFPVLGKIVTLIKNLVAR
jgi:steroid delta-isomerase